MNELIKYQITDDLLGDASSIIESAQKAAFRTVNAALVMRNWLLGKRIHDEELKGADRAEYGMEIVEKLSESLTAKYGKGFNKRTVYKFQQFYKYFPEIVRSVTAQFDDNENVPSTTAQLLTWTHFKSLPLEGKVVLQAPDEVSVACCSDPNLALTQQIEITYNGNTIKI